MVRKSYAKTNLSRSCSFILIWKSGLTAQLHSTFHPQSPEDRCYDSSYRPTLLSEPDVQAQWLLLEVVWLQPLLTTNQPPPIPLNPHFYTLCTPPYTRVPKRNFWLLPSDYLNANLQHPSRCHELVRDAWNGARVAMTSPPSRRQLLNWGWEESVFEAGIWTLKSTLKGTR